MYAVDKYDPDFELLDKLNCSHCAHGGFLIVKYIVLIFFYKDDIILRPNG